VGEDGLPGEPLHLIVARDVLNPGDLKFFVSNAPEETPVDSLLVVAFSRWPVERCFEDGVRQSLEQKVGLSRVWPSHTARLLWIV